VGARGRTREKIDFALQIVANGMVNLGFSEKRLTAHHFLVTTLKLFVSPHA